MNNSPTSRVLREEEAWKELGPYLPQLHWVLNSAWQDWQNLIAENGRLAVAHNSLCRAVNVHVFIMQRAREAFDGVDGVHLTEDSGVIYISIGSVVLKFNKLDAEHCPRLSQSARAQGFRDQQMWMFPDAIPRSAVNLYVGYELDAVGSSLSDLGITCMLGDELWWYRPIPKPSADQCFDIFPTSPPPADSNRWRKKDRDQGVAPA